MFMLPLDGLGVRSVPYFTPVHRSCESPDVQDGWT